MVDVLFPSRTRFHVNVAGSNSTQHSKLICKFNYKFKIRKKQFNYSLIVIVNALTWNVH